MKTATLLATASAVALGAGVIGLARSARPRRNSPGNWPVRHAPAAVASRADQAQGGATAPEARDEVDARIRDFIGGFVIPLSASAGIADWLCHRASDIEDTAGAPESILHLLMLAEVGVPLATILFVEITAPALALLLASFVVHELTALVDVSYAAAHREVTPAEQMIHSVMEMTPLLALSFVAALRWPQFLALFGLGDEKPDLGIRLRKEVSPIRRTLLACGPALLQASLYLEELWRDLQATRATPDRRHGPREHD
jgi:hypothetical protein